jgi:hypothetical protein
VATWAFAITLVFWLFRVIIRILGMTIPDAFFLRLNGGCGRPRFRSVIKGRNELPNLHGAI